jgi:hypothetical protein
VLPGDNQCCSKRGNSYRESHHLQSRANSCKAGNTVRGRLQIPHDVEKEQVLAVVEQGGGERGAAAN